MTDLRPLTARHDELIAAVRMVRMRRDSYAMKRERAARYPHSENIEIEKQLALRMVREAEQALADVMLELDGAE
jgi:hypothetical protein